MPQLGIEPGSVGVAAVHATMPATLQESQKIVLLCEILDYVAQNSAHASLFTPSNIQFIMQCIVSILHMGYIKF